MRWPAVLLLALSAMLPTGASAQATLNKCTDEAGQVTYSNLPCRNAREARTLAIDPAPLRDPVPAAPAPVEPAKPAQPKATPGAPRAPGSLRLDTQRAGKPATAASTRQCASLTDKLGRILDKMDAARRKGYTQDEMNAWNLEIKELERKKQQSGCF